MASSSSSSSILHYSLQSIKDKNVFSFQYKKLHHILLPKNKLIQIRSCVHEHRPAFIEHRFLFNNKSAGIQESQLTEQKEARMKIAIVGLGNFGQFIAKGLTRQGHMVMATSRSDYTHYCRQNEIQFYRAMDAMCEEKPDIILICSSILSTENIVRAIPFHKLNPHTIFVDVLSVKQFPRNLFLEVLPPDFGIICTHPMFGPESGKGGWEGLPFVYDRVRIDGESLQAVNCQRFLNIFEHEVKQW